MEAKTPKYVIIFDKIIHYQRTNESIEPRITGDINFQPYDPQYPYEHRQLYFIEF
jgi:hypothetical protein